MNMIIVIMLCAFLSGLVQAITGFGGAVVMMMFLPLFLSMNIAPALAGLTCIPTCITMAIRYRKKINRKYVAVPTLIYLVSSSICIRIASQVDLDGLKAVFGLLLVGLAVYFSFFSSRLKLEPNLRTAFLCAGISGITGGLFGIGGPLLVLYYLAISRDKEEYLGTVNLVFTVTESYSAIVRYFSGIISPDLLPWILSAFAAVLVGRYFGSMVIDRIDADIMKKCIYVLLALAGIITFLNAMNIL